MSATPRVAVITGAASGIGRALAENLAGRGWNLALVDRDGSGLQALAAHLPSGPNHISCHRADLSLRETPEALLAAVLQQHGEVHWLINNAGVALGGRFDQVSEEDFDWVMEINFHAVVRMTRAFLPSLRAARPAARIVNLSSLYGLLSPPEQAAYSASKFAVRGFSNALRHELAGSSVSVTVVHPGGVATAIASNARVPLDADPAEVVEKRRAAEQLLRMPPALAAQIIVAGIERGRARILVGFDAKLMALLERLLPVGYWSLVGPLVEARSKSDRST